MRQCSEGHIYELIRFFTFPEGAPTCPLCYWNWAEENGKEVPIRIKISARLHMSDDKDARRINDNFSR